MEKRDVRLDDGTRIRCHLDGPRGAPPVVLLHALGQDSSTWATVVARLVPHFSVLTLDLRGHGGSDRPGRYTHELMAEDVVGVLDHLGLREVVLVGHSLGGVVAMMVAIREPQRVGRLVVEDVVPPFPFERPLRERPDRPLPFDWDVVPAILTEANDPTRRWWPALRTITAPTLLVGGGAESHIPAEELEEVARSIPDCTLITIPAGHHVHAAQPEAFSDALLTWLGVSRPGERGR